MKYAFIALIACYLLVYGCGPDNSKKTEVKKEQAVHSTVEKPTQPTQATQPQETAKQPVAAAVDATPQPIQQGAIELTQPDEENIVVMPCGCMFIKHPMPANAPYVKNAPCVQQQAPPCPMMGEKQPATDEELIMMPCGRVFVKQPMPVDGLDLERPLQMEEPEEDLAGAVQRMAEATNDMVLVTKQLVVATQEMLKATKGAASEGANTNRENNRQTEQTNQSPWQAAIAAAKNQSADKEQEAVNAMKDAVIATQKAIDAMNQTVPKTVDQRQ